MYVKLGVFTTEQVCVTLMAVKTLIQKPPPVHEYCDVKRSYKLQTCLVNYPYCS